MAQPPTPEPEFNDSDVGRRLGAILLYGLHHSGYNVDSKSTVFAHVHTLVYVYTDYNI